MTGDQAQKNAQSAVFRAFFAPFFLKFEANIIAEMNAVNLLLQIKELAGQCGFHESGYVSIPDLTFYPEVRSICEGNSCRHYATSWACPPAVGSIGQCRERVHQYDHMLLFSGRYALEDSFDFEAMSEGLRDFKRLVDRFHQGLEQLLPGFLLLSNEGCGRCAVCTYPDAPCRFPQLLHHSLEGYGFIVSELAKSAKIRYHNGPNTVTYFGALLFSLPPSYGPN